MGVNIDEKNGFNDDPNAYNDDEYRYTCDLFRQLKIIIG